MGDDSLPMRWSDLNFNHFFLSFKISFLLTETPTLDLNIGAGFKGYMGDLFILLIYRQEVQKGY